MKRRIPDRGVRTLHSRDRWTPGHVIDAARYTMGGIDLDPASCEEANWSVGASTYYTAEQDGLQHDWFGKVWLNPPYDYQLVSEFMHRLVDDINRGRVEQAVAVVLDNFAASWYRDVLRSADALAICRSITFIHPYEITGDALAQRTYGFRGNAIVGFNVDVTRFTKAMLELPECFSVWTPREQQ